MVKMPKRRYQYIAPGAYIGGRRYVRRRVSSRGMRRVSRGRTISRSLTNRGPRPNFMFHRWVSTLPVFSSAVQGAGVNFDPANMSYSNTDGLIRAGTAPATSWNFAIAFSLNQLPNVGEFTSLFDQYRINAVKLSIKMVNDPSANNQPNDGAAVNRGNYYPTLWYAPDHDDNNIESLPNLKEFEKVRHKVLRPNKEISIMLRPTVLGAVYNSLTTTAYTTSTRKQYMDMANINIPHYGIKACIDYEGLLPPAPPGTTPSFLFKVNAKFYFQCKNSR